MFENTYFNISFQRQSEGLMKDTKNLIF